MNKSIILNYLLSHPIFNDNNSYIGYYHNNGYVLSFEVNKGVVSDDILDAEIDYIYETWSHLWNKDELFIKDLQFENRPEPILHWSSIFDSTYRWNSIFYEKEQLNIQFNIKKQNNQNIQYQWLLWDFIYPISQWFSILWPNGDDGNVFMWYLNYTELERDLMAWYYAFKKIGLPQNFTMEEHMIFQNTIPKTFKDWFHYYNLSRDECDECNILI